MNHAGPYAPQGGDPSRGGGRRGGHGYGQNAGRSRTAGEHGAQGAAPRTRREARQLAEHTASTRPPKRPATAAQRRALADEGIARHGRLAVMSAGRSIGKLFGLTAFVLVSTLVILGTVVALKFMATLGGGTDIGAPGDAPPPQNLASIPGGANVLVIGSDDRSGQGAEFGEGQDEASGVLNDVNMVIHISEDLQHITAVSIPRDTIVDTPDCTNDEGKPVESRDSVPFNSILHEGGMRCVVTAAEKLSGLDIQYSAIVKFRGVIEMSNAVGGVNVCVANKISDDYVGLYLSPGVHSLGGEDALKFLRSRHGVGDGSDIARISNQQVFLSALIRTVKSGDTLTNVGKVYGLAQAVTRNMKLSSSLDLNTITAFANVISNVPQQNIVFAQLPTASSSQAGKVEPLEPDASRMWLLLRSDTPLNVASGNQTAPPDTAGPSAPPSTAAPASPSETAAPGATVPSATPEPTLAGQTADQETCSNVNG